MAQNRPWGITLISLLWVMFGFYVLYLVLKTLPGWYRIASMGNLQAFQVFGFFFSLFEGFAFIVGGIALWRVASWGRNYGLVIAGIVVVMKAVGLVLFFLSGRPISFVTSDLFGLLCLVAFVYLLHSSVRQLFESQISGKKTSKV